MERRLTAILAADVVGYSRLMGANESETLATLKKLQTDFIDGKIAEHQGRIVKLTGDGMLGEFSSVVNAVACAAEVQRGMRERNADVPQDRRIEFRIGVNVGDVIVEREDIFGDGVNVAARLESIAPVGGIAVSQSVRDHVGNRLDLTFEDMGERRLKNIERPIRVYSISLDLPASGGSTDTASGPRAEKPSIAVLPFNNMSGDPEQEYFGDGITEDIITDLSKISGLSVIARNTSFTYKGRAVKVQNVGQELGVEFILEGSVRKAGPRVRVTAQLITSSDGTHIWAERFDRDLTDIFAIQDEITHAIVEQLKVQLLPQEKKAIGQAPTDNVEAYNYYLRGRDFLYRHSKRYYDLARRMFTKALELDPNYGRAYAGMALCDGLLLMTYKADLSTEGTLELADKALAMESNLAIAHTARGVALTIAHRFEEANREFELGIALAPSTFEVHFLSARPFFTQGNIVRAVEALERAAEIDPLDYKAPALAIMMYRSLRRESDCTAAARKTVELGEQAAVSNPEDPRPAIAVALALLELGEKERARDWTRRAQAIESEDTVTVYNIACIYSHLTEPESACDLLEKVVRESGSLMYDWIKNDSDLDGIRDHPRFQKLLAQIG